MNPIRVAIRQAARRLRHLCCETPYPSGELCPSFGNQDVADCPPAAFPGGRRPARVTPQAERPTRDLHYFGFACFTQSFMKFFSSFPERFYFCARFLQVVILSCWLNP
jgi:hypothetical protein